MRRGVWALLALGMLGSAGAWAQGFSFGNGVDSYPHGSIQPAPTTFCLLVTSTLTNCLLIAGTTTNALRVE